MWTETFQTIAKENRALPSRFLRDRIPLVIRSGSRVSSSLIERTSAVLAARLPLHLEPEEKRRLVFLLPNATQNLGRFLAVSLLLTDFVHRNGIGVPDDEKGSLLQGDLLLITQHIRECVSLLREVCVRYSTESLPITKFWPIEVLSQYSPPPNNKPRVFVANPGWFQMKGSRRKFGSVVIDVSHPRTSKHLENLLQQEDISASPIQVLVTPPCEEEKLKKLCGSGRQTGLAWAWDPAAQAALDATLSVTPQSIIPSVKDRTIWICDDEVLDGLLSELHLLLVGAMRACGGNAPGRLLETWSVYHRFRQLVVPLVELEEQRQRAYKTLTIGERIKALEEDLPTKDGISIPYLDAHWPRIIDILKRIYETLLKQKEPAKFYTLASTLEQQLKKESFSIRVIAPTAHEGNILATLLSELVDGWRDALQSGVASITTVREEPRLIADGQIHPSMLLGYRTSDTRHLDVYPGVPIQIIAYPYEAKVDDFIQRRIHTSIERLQENDLRRNVLEALRLPVTSETISSVVDAPRTVRPQTTLQYDRKAEEQHLRDFLDENCVEPLDIETLAGLTWSDEIIIGPAEQSPTSHDQTKRRSIEFVEVLTTSGERLRYPSMHLVDVYYPATQKKERISARELKAGMLMVVLVDDPYEDLFQRLLEAIRQEGDMRVSIALDLWHCAKQAALTKCGGNRQKLYELLSAKGISVEYPAVVRWYASGEQEIIAPDKEDDFKILAVESGLYSDPAIMASTFLSIRKERILRRKSGRLLSRFLTQIAAGKHYEAALESAQALGTPLEQVAAAVSLQGVEDVRRLGTILDM